MVSQYLGSTDPKEQYHKGFSGVQKTKLASAAFFLNVPEDFLVRLFQAFNSEERRNLPLTYRAPFPLN